MKDENQIMMMVLAELYDVEIRIVSTTLDLENFYFIKPPKRKTQNTKIIYLAHVVEFHYYSLVTKEQLESDFFLLF